MNTFLLVGALLSATASTTKTDEFLWLEIKDDAKALAWVKEQNDKTLSAFKDDPTFKKFEKAFKEASEIKGRITSPMMLAGEVYNFWQDNTNIKGLVRKTSVKEFEKDEPQWETVLDLDALSKLEDKNWHMKTMTCLEPKTTLCLVALSDGVQTATVIREFDLGKKEFVKDGFFVSQSNTFLTWENKDSIIVSTETDDKGISEAGYPIVVQRWDRKGNKKTIFTGEKSDMRAYPISAFHQGENQIFVRRMKTIFKSEVFFLNNEKLERLPLPEDFDFKTVHLNKFIFALNQDWVFAGKTYKIGHLYAYDLSKKIIEELYRPVEKEAIQDLITSKDYIFINVLNNVKSRVYRVDIKNKEKSLLPLPEYGSIRLLQKGRDSLSNKIFVMFEDFLTPSSLWEVDADALRVRSSKSLPSQFNSADMEILQLQARSKDGTLIPYFLIKKKSAQKNVPTLLWGYGGFGASYAPFYLGGVIGKMWLEKGGAYALANIRGGGEFGPAWHKAAIKENRQRSFDDFIGVASSLVKRKITSPKKLGIMGGSNGGLLTGVAFTQAPELFNAVVCQAPVLDMLRFSKLPPGVSWLDEYGNPDVPEERIYLEKYSPYHNVKETGSYPEIFISTSSKDQVVNPGHGRKMAAKLAALGHKYYFYEDVEAGHGLVDNKEHFNLKSSLEYTYLTKKLFGE